MKNSVSKFLSGASQFFQTSPHAKAYQGVFPKAHLQSLFYDKKDLEKEEGETEEDTQRKSEKRIEKINQTLQAFASAPEAEQPDYPDQAVEIINEYQRLALEKASGGSVEQVAVKQESLDQKFNSFVEKSGAPLAGLMGAATQTVVTKAAAGVAPKILAAAVGVVNPVVGAIAAFVGKEVLSKVATWVIRNKERFFQYLGGGLAVGGLVVGGTIGTVSTVAGVGIAGVGLIGEAGGVGAAMGNLAATGTAALSAITAATIEAMIGPLIIAIIGIPVVVAFILFIINSGAYVVPGSSAIVQCTDPANCPVQAGCPTGWPLVPLSRVFPIVQGPGGLYTHTLLEAIDITTGGRIGFSVKATHPGVIYRIYPNQDYDAFGKLVVIKGSCNGKDFYSMYSHLATVGVSAGQVITAGQEVGLSGATGTDNAHLHYEFRQSFSPFIRSGPTRPPYMGIPYIPKNVKRGCYNGVNPSASDPCLINIP